MSVLLMFFSQTPESSDFINPLQRDRTITFLVLCGSLFGHFGKTKREKPKSCCISLFLSQSCAMGVNPGGT